MKNKINFKKIDFKNVDIKKVLSIVFTVILVAAHIAIVLIFIKGFRYYAIYPALFNYLTIIVLCIFIIIDIVYFIGLKHYDLLQKIISTVMAVLLIIVGVYGTVTLNKTNTLVDNVVQTDTSADKYETITGIFVTYDEEYSKVSSLADLKKFSNLKIGSLSETSEDSISAVGKDTLKEANITSYSSVSYTNNTDLLFALIKGEIDVAIFTSMYKAIFRADDNVDYTQYLDEMNEFGEFSKDILIANNASTKDLSKDPFNVLLIGWSPIIGSTTIGLADAIIVCTVNPQTYTVSMMSIARDSYVPIACYGGEEDKINSGRGTSMDCFVSTVEDLIDEEIDFYMEINFAGFAELCGLLGGIEINNPVDFTLDGVYVPAGNYVADGWQTLEFARERHHMPNGDFDRQQHQKEVIMQIAKKFLKHDLTFALDIFNEISDTLNTNMTFDQIAGVFNMLKNTKNYTGLSLFNMLDMHALRLTGYADWHYSDEYELPLWIYRLYDGSVSESLTHMQEVMGNYTSIDQDSGFYFDECNPYVREAFYSTSYDEVEIHETLPPYYVNLTSMTYKEAKEWAVENGATLVPTFIYPDEEGYDEELDGMVISQSVSYGKKVSKYPSCNITVMGNGKRKVTLPDYENWTSDWLKQVKLWCEDNEFEKSQIEYKVTYISKDNAEGYKNEQVYKMKYDSREDKLYIYYYYVCGDNASPNSEGTDCVCNTNYEKDTEDNNICKLKKTYTYKKDGTVVDTKTQLKQPSWTNPDSVNYTCKWSDDGLTFTCTKHNWDEGTVTTKATCTEKGVMTYKCTDSGCTATKTVEIDALGHDYQFKETVAPSGETAGYDLYECTHDTSHTEKRNYKCSDGYQLSDDKTTCNLSQSTSGK